MATLVRGGGRAARRRAAAAEALRRAECPRRVRRRGGDHDRRDGRHGAVDGDPLRAGVAGVAAREPAGRARDRADHVARRARGRRGAGAPSRWPRRSRPGGAAARDTSQRVAHHTSQAPLCDRRRGTPTARRFDRRGMGRAGARRRSRATPLGVAAAEGVTDACSPQPARAGARRGARRARRGPGRRADARGRGGWSCRSSTWGRATRRSVQRGREVGADRHRRRGRPDPASASREAGIDRLDALILTHAEADHEGAAPQVIGALQAAARGQRRRRLAVAACNGRRGRRRDEPRARSRRGERARARRTAVRGPVAAARAPAGGRGNPNDNAMVARLEAGRLLDAAGRRRRKRRAPRCRSSPSTS